MLFLGKTKVTVAIFYSVANVTFKCSVIGLQFNTKLDTNVNHNYSTSPHQCSLKICSFKKSILKLTCYCSVLKGPKCPEYIKKISIFASGKLFTSFQKG